MKPNNKINQIICIDFETGGFHASKNPATEVGVITFRADTFEEIDRYESYIKPYDKEYGLKYEQSALDFTGTTMEDLEKGKPMKEVVKDLQEIFKKANTGKHVSKKPVILGHNVGFDIPFLMFMFEAMKADLKSLVEGKLDHRGELLPTYHDTMWEARKKWPIKGVDIKDHKLESCIEKAGIEVFDAHKAMNDVIATKELFCYFMGCLRSSPETQGLSVSDQGVEQRFRNTFQF